MTHGDDSGLVLPPKIAPTQVMVIPIAAHKAGVTEKANEVCARLKAFCRAGIDTTDNSPGWKFAQYEMKGVPLRLELGPKDIEKNQCVLVRRDNREKIFVSLDDLETEIPKVLEAVQQGLYDAALERRANMTYSAASFDELKDIADNKPGFIKAMWCGDRACEDKLKEDAGVTSRCIPFAQEHIGDTCVCCGKPATKMLYWGKAY